MGPKWDNDNKDELEGQEEGEVPFKSEASKIPL